MEDDRAPVKQFAAGYAVEIGFDYEGGYTLLIFHTHHGGEQQNLPAVSSTNRVSCALGAQYIFINNAPITELDRRVFEMQSVPYTEHVVGRPIVFRGWVARRMNDLAIHPRLEIHD